MNAFVWADRGGIPLGIRNDTESVQIIKDRYSPTDYGCLGYDIPFGDSEQMELLIQFLENSSLDRLYEYYDHRSKEKEPVFDPELVNGDYNQILKRIKSIVERNVYSEEVLSPVKLMFYGTLGLLVLYLPQEGGNASIFIPGIGIVNTKDYFPQDFYDYYLDDSECIRKILRKNTLPEGWIPLTLGRKIQYTFYEAYLKMREDYSNFLSWSQINGGTNLDNILRAEKGQSYASFIYNWFFKRIWFEKETKEQEILDFLDRI